MKKFILICLLLPFFAFAQVPIKLSWSANSESDLSHYAIYTSYDNIVFTQDTITADTAITIKMLTEYSWIIIAVTAIDSSGNESEFSESVQKYRIDINSDKIIDGIDWMYLKRFWGTRNVLTDLNNDGLTDGLDQLILQRNWGRVFP